MSNSIGKFLAICLLSIPASALAGHHIIGPGHEKDSPQKEKLPVEQRAVDALAKHLSLADKSSIKVVSKQEKNWPDGSLGCPQPGMMYPQVIVPGHLVKLTMNGESHSVHMSNKGAVVCKNKLSKNLSNGKKHAE